MQGRRDLNGAEFNGLDALTDTAGANDTLMMQVDTTTPGFGFLSLTVHYQR